MLLKNDGLYMQVLLTKMKPVKHSEQASSVFYLQFGFAIVQDVPYNI